MTQAPPRESRCGNAALAYAARGWKVIPLHNPVTGAGAIICSCEKDDCPSPAKHPRTVRGLKDATTDEATIREWWRRWPSANVGVVTGAESGIVVLDMDAGKGGPESLERLTERCGGLPFDTVTANTGGGGNHLIFVHPGRPVRNSSCKLGAGLDVRGDGGYIVAPPSVHISGSFYAWRSFADPDEIDPTPLPALLLKAMTEEPRPVPTEPHRENDRGAIWLGKALAKATFGNRNETGLWLACQLRDAGLFIGEAELTMRAYADRCPHGDRPYTVAEAVASCRSAFSQAPRDSAKGVARPAKAVAPSDGAGAELMNFYGAVADGAIYNVPWPWDGLTRLTQALTPGSVTVVCGDPGVGKTFWVLQCLRDWHAKGFPVSIFFAEKDRKFHTSRLLAQLEDNSNLINLDWIKANAHVALGAANRHRAYVDELGKLIHSAPPEHVTLDTMLGWVREQCAHGRRVMVIDPITAVDAGKDRWTADQQFVTGCGKALTAAGASLVLITHAKKGNRFGGQTGHDMAGGAAYHRFADTNLWLVRTKEPKTCKIQTPCGPATMDLRYFFQIEKARDGKGSGMQLGYRFGDGLYYAEQGLVIPEKKGEASE